MAYQQAIAAQPHFPEAYNNLGNAYRETNRPVDAITCYISSIQLQYAQAGVPTVLPGLTAAVADPAGKQCSKQFSSCCAFLSTVRAHVVYKPLQLNLFNRLSLYKNSFRFFMYAQ